MVAVVSCVVIVVASMLVDHVRLQRLRPPTRRTMMNDAVAAAVRQSNAVGWHVSNCLVAVEPVALVVVAVVVVTVNLFDELTMVAKMQTEHLGWFD